MNQRNRIWGAFRGECKRGCIPDEKRLRIYPLKESFEDFFHIPDPDNAGVGTKDKI